LVVVDRYGRYAGLVYITDLLLKDPDTTVDKIMDASAEPINASMPAPKVAQLFENRDLISAVVVNNENVVLGRITIDDVVDVIREEADHSLMRMAGLDTEEDMFAPVLPAFRRRAMWLGVNLLTAFLASSVVGAFQATIQHVVVLAVLMPIVASMGGIAGTQVLTLMIRSLALGQVGRSNFRKLLIKEVSIGLLNGLAWAVVLIISSYIVFDNLVISLTVGLAMLTNLFIAACAGMGVPILLRRMKVDPALAGPVILTTFTDVIGFFSLLGIGTLLLF
jgi:magnesium transporter